jgi:hypothetical protein
MIMRGWRVFTLVHDIDIWSVLRPALLAQLGERQTEDLKVLCSIHRQSTFTFVPPQKLPTTVVIPTTYFKMNS